MSECIRMIAKVETLGDALKYILKYPQDHEWEDYEELVDDMKKAIQIMLPSYHARITRNGQRAIAKKNQGICELCGKKTAILQLHHVVPVSQFGTNDTENIKFLCKEYHKKTMNSQYFQRAKKAFSGRIEQHDT